MSLRNPNRESQFGAGNLRSTAGTWHENKHRCETNDFGVHCSRITTESSYQTSSLESIGCGPLDRHSRDHFRLNQKIESEGGSTDAFGAVLPNRRKKVPEDVSECRTGSPRVGISSRSSARRFKRP